MGRQRRTHSGSSGHEISAEAVLAIGIMRTAFKILNDELKELFMMKKLVLCLSTLLCVHQSLESLSFSSRLYSMLRGAAGVRAPHNCHLAAVNPLIKNIGYQTFHDYLDEDNVETVKRQERARKLVSSGSLLSLSQTESIIVGLQDAAQNKKDLKFWVSFESADHKENFETMFQKEKHAHHDDKIVMYHAMVAPIYALNYIRSSLYHAQKKLHAPRGSGTVPSFFFMRQPLKDYAQRAHEDFEHARAITPSTRRTYLLAPDEISTPHDHHFYRRYHLLSCSPSLVSCQDGESAVAWYGFSKNAAAHDVLSEYSFLEGLAIPYHTKAHYKDLLKQAVEKLAYQGVMLQIILSAYVTDQASYCARPYGYKEHLVHAGTGSTFKTTCEVIKSMKSNPFSINKRTDQLQMRLVLTDDLLLNPEHQAVQKGFEVHAYSHDQKKLNHFNKHVDSMMDELVKELHTLSNQEPKTTQTAMASLQKFFWP